MSDSTFTSGLQEFAFASARIDSAKPGRRYHGHVEIASSRIGIEHHHEQPPRVEQEEHLTVAAVIKTQRTLRYLLWLRGAFSGPATWLRRPVEKAR